eukprot:TRINITY_DN10139_c0_g2_i2.p1 TRINITY_DN10139_c0_g2~~TRINITY_DN10139_c0_g2_i2.p1  ORF type:complete len:1098 (+),score=269.19 TRINITY_DN10139_c0_g2_i2:103-3396(+)
MRAAAAAAAVLLCGAAQGYKIGVMWPATCSGDNAEFCALLTKGAQAAIKTWKEHSHAKWTPQLVHPYAASASHSSSDSGGSSGHRRGARPLSASVSTVHDTFDGMCDMIHAGVSAFVGPLTAQEAQLIARVSGWHQIPMVTPAASAEELGDRVLYPYLRRTHPSVVAQGDAIAEFIRRLNWTSMGVLYEKHNIRYESLMRSLTGSFAYFNGRVAHVEGLVAGLPPNGYQETLRHLREHHVQVIAVLGTSQFITSLTEAGLNPEHPPPLYGGGRVWIASEEAPDPLVGVRHLWDGHPEWGCPNRSHDIHASPCACDACQKHLKDIHGLLSVALPINETNEHVLALAHYLGLHDDELRKLDIYERTAYDAVYHVLEGLDATGAWRYPYHSSSCSKPATAAWAQGPGLLKWLDEHPLDGATGHIDMRLMDSSFRHDLVNLQKPHGADEYDWHITGTFYPRSDWPEDGTHGAPTPSSSHSRRMRELATEGSGAAVTAGSAAAAGSGDAAAGSTTGATDGTTDVLDHPLKVAVYDGSAIHHKYCPHCEPFDWPGSGVAPDPLHLLKGMHLHVLTYEDPPYLILNHSRKDCDDLNPTPEVGCYSGALWELLLDFKHRFHFTFDTKLQHGHLQDAVDLLGEAHSPYDVLLANIAITEARQKIVDLTQPLFETEIVMLARRPSESASGLFFFLEPFTVEMWLCVIGLIVVNAVVFYWLERGVNDGIDTGLRGSEDSLYFSFTAFLFTADIAPATRGGRLLTAGFYFTALIALSTYTAQLTVFLLQQNTQYEFESFQSFLPGQGTRTMSQVLVTQDSVEAQWACIQCSCCQKPGGGPTKIDFLPATADQEEVHAHHLIVEKLIETCALPGDSSCPLGALIEKFLAQYLVKTHCELSIHHSAGKGLTSQDDVPHLLTFGLGIALKRGSPYTAVFSEEILYLKEHQKISDMQHKWFDNTVCPSMQSLPYKSQIEVGDFYGMYMIFGALVVITIAYKEIWTKYMTVSGNGVDIDGDGVVDDVVNRKMSMHGSQQQQALMCARIDRMLQQLGEGAVTPRPRKSMSPRAIDCAPAQISVAPLMGSIPDEAPPNPRESAPDNDDAGGRAVSS